MIKDLMFSYRKLVELSIGLKASLDTYSTEIDGIATADDEAFSIEMVQLLHNAEELQERMKDTIDSFQTKILGHPATMSNATVVPFGYENFITQQAELMTLVEEGLQLPLELDLSIVSGLTDMVYHYGYGAASGIAKKIRPQCRFMMIAISGWMLIKHYGGEFIKDNGLTVRLPGVRCIVQVELNSNNAHFFEWFSSVITHLNGLQNGVPILEPAKGVIVY